MLDHVADDRRTLAQTTALLRADGEGIVKYLVLN